MKIKELFETAEDGKLTYEQFEAIAKERDAKFADLSEGKYVSKSKYDSDLSAKDAELSAKDVEMDGLSQRITTLNDTITTRDNDLADLQQKLADAGQDATKLADLTSQFTALQGKYEADTKAYQDKMNQQAYEFAVKEFANTQHFSSQAAKRDFTKAMIDKQLQMENGKLIGGDDFVKIYSEDNADAFYVEPEPTPEPQPAPEPTPAPVPEIVAPTPGPSPDDGSNGFNFNFTGVRSHE